MTPEEFAAAIKNTVFDVAVQGLTDLLTRGAPGRVANPRADALKEWYAGLGERRSDDAHRGHSRRGPLSDLRLVHASWTAFSAIDDPPHVELMLTAMAPDGTATTLASTQTPIELHDEFNAEVHPPSEPWPPAP